MRTQPDPRATDERPLAATPRLERLLLRLRARLRAQVWLHGVGTLLGVVSLWLAFAFFADWALHVPRGVRLLHLVVLLALPVAVVWRELARHLRRLPGRAGLAVLVERAHPELGELLVSAVELQRDGKPRAESGDPRLIERVLRDADARAERLELAGVLAPRRPRRRFALGAALSALLALLALAWPGHARIFADRLFGGGQRWPQLTHLLVSVPLGGAGERARVEETPERIEIKLARGSDLPVLVRAEGRVPEEVTVHFAGGNQAVLGPSGERTFRTLLRALQEDVELWVTGGDDRDGLPRVSVEVLEPPDVRGLAIRVEPPAYTGLPAQVLHDHDVEVLAGSRLGVAMLPDPPEVRGRARILPEDRLVELEPRPFPAPGGAEGATLPGLGFDLLAESSLRFRFELEDDSGLSNPDPGLFAVHVVEDRPPQVELLAPGRGDVDTVAGGLLSLRVRAEDDFGIAAMEWSATPLSRGEAPAQVRPLEPTPAPPQVRGDVALAGAATLAGTRIEVASLAADAAPGPQGAAPLEGEQFQIEVAARDTRPPLAGGEPDPAGVGRSAPVRVRVVSEEEFMRRLQDRLARLRTQAGALEELQREKARGVRDLIAALESDQPEQGASASELAGALAGQRRVQGDASVLARDLAAATEGVLYARIDDQALALLDEVDQRLAASASKGFQATVWREALRAQEGRSGTGLAAQLAAMLELALSISEEETRRAVEALGRAGEEVDLARVHQHLLAAAQAQQAAQKQIEELLGRLAEWDNFQSVLSLTRDILNRQKNLRERTKEAAGQK